MCVQLRYPVCYQWDQPEKCGCPRQVNNVAPLQINILKSLLALERADESFLEYMP